MPIADRQQGRHRSRSAAEQIVGPTADRSSSAYLRLLH